MAAWVYIVRCADDTLYTGAAIDLSKRIAIHNDGRGAKYTRGRRPVVLVYRRRCAGFSEALKREAAIKKLSRSDKENLLNGSIFVRIKPVFQIVKRNKGGLVSA